ncbi:MAG: acyltransferase [Candidatus Thermoplasmatota archaeon]|nr:acyltransferase [Candidatus Thermoplasmatota archaeon]
MIRRILRSIIIGFLNLKKKVLMSLGLMTDHKGKIEKMIKDGMRVGKNVLIHPEAKIDPHYCYLIEIGDNTIISRDAKILAHDASTFPHLEGWGRLGRVHIKENCIIGTDVIVLPGVTIGPNVVVASGSLVNKDIPPNSCVVGVPARFYSTFDKYLEYHKERIKNSFTIDGNEVMKPEGIDPEVKRRLIEESKKGDIYMSGCKGMKDARINFLEK